MTDITSKANYDSRIGQAVNKHVKDTFESREEEATWQERWAAGNGFWSGVRWAQANPQWVPVAEQLPETDGEYEVTIRFDDGGLMVDRNVFEAGQWNGSHVSVVLAWRELPRPYRPAEEARP